MALVVQDDNIKINPSYYKFKINDNEIELYDLERVIFSTQSLYDHLLMQALEYIIRSFEKNGLEDIQKARNCLNKALSMYNL